MKQIGKILGAVIEGLTHLTGWIAALSLVAAAIIVTEGVIVRKIFGISTIWQIEASVYLLIFTVFSGSAANTFHQGANILYINGNFAAATASFIFDGGTGKVVFDASSGTITYSNSGTGTFNDVEVDNNGVTSFSLSSDLDVNGDLILTAGKLDRNDKIIRVGGSWLEEAGFSYVG